MYTNDLIKRLRAYGGPGLSAAKACLLAADEIERLRKALTNINRRLSPGTRTFDDLMRDAEWACDEARAALSATSENRTDGGSK